MGEEDIRRIMTHRYQMFGTDSVAGKLLPGLKLNHPRTFGTTLNKSINILEKCYIVQIIYERIFKKNSIIH